MRTEWTLWDLNDMVDAAELESRVTLSALGVPETARVESLPYFSGLLDYGRHMADCRRDDRPDCARGEGLLELSRIGVEEQHRAAVNN